MEWIAFILIWNYLSIVLYIMGRLINFKLLGYLIFEYNDSLSFRVIDQEVPDRVQSLDVFLLNVPRVRVVFATINATLYDQKMLKELHMFCRLKIFRWQLH